MGKIRGYLNVQPYKDSSRQATNYLSYSAVNGVDVGYSGLNSKVNIKGDGIRLYDGLGGNCAFFGIDGNNPSVRIGKTDLNGHIRITPTSGVRFLRDDDSTPMAQLASDGLQIWSNDGTNNISSAFFGAECRVGATADKNIYIGNGVINFRDNGTSLGEFTGTTARIGATSGKNIYITTNAVNFRDNGTDIGYISGTAARLGSPNSEGNITFDTTEGFRVWNAGQTASYAQIKDGYGRIGALGNGHINIYPSGFEIYRKATGDTDPVSIGYFGIYNSKGWARIGALGENHINIDGTYNGIEIFRKTDTDTSPVSVAWFGSATRIGPNDDARVIINPSYFNIYNAQNDNTFSIGLASSSMTYRRYVYSSYLSSSVDITMPNIANGTTVYIDTESPGGGVTSESFTVGTASTGVEYTYDGNKALTLNPTSGAYFYVYYSITANPPVWTLGSRVGGRGGFSATVGLGNRASGNYSMAVGSGASATGPSSFAHGGGSVASGSYSFATGQTSRATGSAQTVIGKNNATDSTKAFIIGNGTGQDLDFNRYRNALTVDWDGNVKTSGDIYVAGHDTYIGWYDAHFNSANISSGVAYTKLSASEITLSPGRYVVTGTAGYGGATDGYRAIGFCTVVNDTEAPIYESRQIVPTIPSTSWRTYVSTTHIINVAEETKIYITTMQNSGNPLSTDWYIKAIRIR